MDNKLSEENKRNAKIPDFKQEHFAGMTVDLTKALSICKNKPIIKHNICVDCGLNENQSANPNMTLLGFRIIRGIICVILSIGSVMTAIFLYQSRERFGSMVVNYNLMFLGINVWLNYWMIIASEPYIQYSKRITANGLVFWSIVQCFLFLSWGFGLYKIVKLDYLTSIGDL